ncbi:MAG: AMP-binding protein [Rhodoluna sp.]|nr:AMP-binding protein [Rhodoluna sp.]
MSLLQGPEGVTSSTLVEIFKTTAQRHPKAIAIEVGGLSVTYASLLKKAEKLAKKLNKGGVGHGDRVTVQLATGGAELYESILGVLFSGAAYVPVDFEDSPNRVGIITQEAAVAAHISKSGLKFHRKSEAKWWSIPATSDAWVIFTSGSTGVPKAVAVSHRSAANLVIAERELFSKTRPLGPGARVAATLSPAFDASIEEMWLAWSTGATLIPIERRILTSGPDLPEALRHLRIDALSTVPSIARFLQGADLGELRLLILGGEAVTPELAEGLIKPNMELWNTYGPTEATIIATATLLHAGSPVTIGDPIAGAEVAVLDEVGHLVSVGSVGQLVISGVGLGRYLNSELDRTRFRSVPALGWKRAYFTGDYVRVSLQGLEFVGRIDEQVKVGGKRIDLTEVELAASTIEGVTSSAAIASRSDFGDYSISCFLTVDEGFSNEVFKTELQKRLPAGIRPSVHVIHALPLKTSGKVDKQKLAASIEGVKAGSGEGSFSAQQFAKVLGLQKVAEDDNFFELGGTSIKVAQLVVELRAKYNSVTVADLYKYPTPGALEKALGSRVAPVALDVSAPERKPRTANARTFIAIALQLLYGSATAGVVLFYLAAIREHLDPIVLFSVGVGTIAFTSGPGRALVSGLLIRLITSGVEPGSYERNGSIHLRIWLAERITDLFSVIELSGTRWINIFARITGSKVGRECVIESLPPVLGNLKLGDNSTIGRDVHISGWAVQGNNLLVAGFEVGSGVRIGNRSFISEGVTIGAGAEVEHGTLVYSDLAPSAVVTGSPMKPTEGITWPQTQAIQGRAWSLAYSLAPSVLALLYMVQFVPTFLYLSGITASSSELTLGTLANAAVFLGPVSLLLNALTSGLVIRFASRFVKPGFHAVNSLAGFFSWLVERQLQRSRRQSFWLYASVITPLWARFLGAKVGRNCELSTFNGQVGLLTIEDECFIADDASLAPRELKNGWVRLGPVVLERRSFIGNSAHVRAGVNLRSGVLIGVGSEAPENNVPSSSFFGLPPIEFPRHQLQGAESLRYKPNWSLKAKRFGVEVFRLSTGSVSFLLVGLMYLIAGSPANAASGPALWLFLVGALYVSASGVAALATIAAKWALVGRVKSSEHDLWTNFVWRNELVWNFVESLAIPWTAHVAIDTPIHNSVLRLLGARIGANASIATWFLDDPDLIEVGKNAVLMKASDLQTHLFHDRVMQLDRVNLGADVTVGSGSFLLPGSSVGEGAHISAGSLVARGEFVPSLAKLQGNPIEHR